MLLFRKAIQLLRAILKFSLTKKFPLAIWGGRVSVRVFFGFCFSDFQHQEKKKEQSEPVDEQMSDSVCDASGCS